MDSLRVIGRNNEDSYMLRTQNFKRQFSVFAKLSDPDNLLLCLSYVKGKLLKMSRPKSSDSSCLKKAQLTEPSSSCLWTVQEYKEKTQCRHRRTWKHHTERSREPPCCEATVLTTVPLGQEHHTYKNNKIIQVNIVIINSGWSTNCLHCQNKSNSGYLRAYTLYRDIRYKYICSAPTQKL